MPFIVCLTVLFLSGIFILTSCPTVFLGDSGEIITAAYYLGVCHPPGYPLYMLLSKIFTLIPAGDTAYRVNLLAAALGAVSFAAVFMLCREFLFHMDARQERRAVISTAAFISALAFTLHSQFWQLCTQAKGGIYILAVIMSALSLYSALRFLRAGKVQFMHLSLYLAGFLPFIHQSAAIYSLMSVVICIYALRNTPRRLITAAGFMLLSMVTANFYLFFRNAGTSEIAWKGVSGFKGILEHILREAYTAGNTGNFVFSAFINRLWSFLSGLAGSFNVFIVLFAFGAFEAGKKSITRLFTLFYALAVILFLAGSNNISGFERNSVSENSMQVVRQMTPVVNLLFILIACCGLRLIMGKTKNPVNFTAAAVTALFFLTANFSANDNSRKFMGYDHAMNILKTVDAQSRVFTDEDTFIFNTLYVTRVLKKFPDYSVHDRQAAILNRSFYADTDKIAKREQRLLMKRMLEIDAMRKMPGKVYFTNYEDFSKDGFIAEPYGILFIMHQAGHDFKTSEIFRIYSLRDYFGNKQLNIHYRDIIARYFMMRGWEELLGPGRNEAVKQFKLAEATAPDSTSLLSLIASAYLYAAHDKKEAVRYMEKTLALDPYSVNIKRALNVLK
jgi:hypothetical protein